MESPHGTVSSKDGTRIAFERAGAGTTIILVSPALGDRGANAKLARLLTRNFTVINYDRRGRGLSSDTPPYAVEREVEDIEALMEAAGGSAHLFGSSSGAVLALEAAARLREKARTLSMYEPPFIVDGGQPPLPANYLAQLHDLLSQGRRGDAVEYFMREAVGVPDEILDGMRNGPMWPSLEEAAHTLPYDGEVMGDTMSGRPLPAHRWDGVTAPALVMVGGASPNWMQHAGQAIAAALPKAKYRVVEGRDHSAMMSAPQDIATTIYGFFLSERIGR
jgi:pimeloyl-ACP methyl ester carboxylesterase